jgi:hypothetical protein
LLDSISVNKDRCEKYAEFMIDKLYELEDNRGLFVQAQ